MLLFLNITFVLSLVFFAIGVFFWFRSKFNLSFSLVLFGGLLLVLHAIFNENFLHLWDERYHALVALNAMIDPFHLKLIPELLTSWDYRPWTSAYTWLHKQPLFIWQMALGMQIFGTSVQGVRSASVIMFLTMGFAIYRTSKLYFPKSSAWLMLLVYTSPMLLYLTNGRQGMDHNDLAFASYISLAFWSFISYIKNQHIKYVIGIGLACGAAMLTKWLAGSLVLFTFGLYLLVNKDFRLKSWRDLLISGTTSILIFVPWQIYSYIRFPKLFIHEWQYNSLHFLKAVEDHDNSWNYHLTIWTEEFLVLLLLSIGTLFIIRSLPKSSRSLIVTIFFSFIAVHIFYSIAATKLKAFTTILVPYAAFLAAPFIEWLSNNRKRQYAFIVVIAIICTKLYVSYIKIPLAKKPEKYMDFCINLKNTLPPNTVIFNTPLEMFVETSFYTHLTSYDKLPTIQDVKKINNLNREVCILAPPDLQIDSSLASNVILVPADLISSFYKEK